MNSAPDLLPNEFRRLGQIWWLAYAGKATTQYANKGLAYLAQLLARPGQPISALSLEQAALGRPSLAPGSAGEMLSPDALMAYRKRLDDLKSELAEAKQNSDIARHELLSAEWDALTSELKRAFGRGGRIRRAGDDLDRARRRVKMAISRALRRLETAHPQLSTHLSNSVRTGQWLTYTPEDPTSWQL